MNQASRKRQREVPTVDSARFAVFEDLAHEDETVRVKAASRLLKRLTEPSENGRELEYSLKRLFRGLCSSRKAARLGFSIALTEVLSQHGGSDVAGILRSWLDITKTSNQMVGQETRDHVMGQIFGASAIVQSGILFQYGGDQGHWKQLLDSLLLLANKMIWAREQCGWVCLTALGQIEARRLDQSWASTLLNLFVEHRLGKSPECVAVWISAQTKFKDLVKPPKVFTGNDPLLEKNWKSLIDILKETTVVSDEGLKQRSTWSAQPHFAWNIVFVALSDEQFRVFWRQTVDEGLFAAASSSERKHWGLSLFSQQIATAPLDRIPHLFTANLCRCMSHQLASSDRYLHSAAIVAVKAATARVEQDPVAAAVMLARFYEDDVKSLFMSGQLRGKLLDKVLPFAEPETLASLVRNALVPAVKVDQVELVLAAIRIKPYPKLGAPGLGELRKWYKLILRALVESAYFSPQPQESKAREQLEMKIQTLLTTLSTKERAYLYYPHAVVVATEELEQETGKKPLSGSSVEAAVAKARSRITKLAASGKEEDSSQEKALALLLCLCILQIYSGEPDALEALEDLLQCYGDVRSEKVEDRARAADAVVEVILSFTSKPPKLLKNLAQQAFSACTESITGNGIGSLVAVLETKENMSGRDEMFEARDDEDDDGESEVGDEEEDDDKAIVVDGDDSDSGLDSDVEMIDGDNESSDNEEDNEGDDDDGGEEEDEDEIKAFDAKLIQALGTRRLEDDLAHESEESSESDMDDDQMEALDEHLSLMFKQRKQGRDTSKEKKREKKDAKETIAIFKTRVLDLVKVLMDRKQQSPLVLDVLLPLLRLVQSTQNKKLAQRASELVHDFRKGVKMRSGGKGEGDEQGDKEAGMKAESLMRSKELLGKIHELALESGSNQFHASCSQASLLLAKVYISNGGKVEEVEKRYAKTRKIWEKDGEKDGSKGAGKQSGGSSGGSGLKKSFFEDWTHWLMSTKDVLG